MSKRVVYHVTSNDQEWKVKKEGGERASARTDSKADAINAARDLAKAAPGPSQVTVHKQDGTIQTKYRFLSNRRINETAILAGHFQATRERFAATDGPILVLHDTTEFS